MQRGKGGGGAASQDLNQLQLEIQKHFETEFDHRKRLYQIEDQLERFGFALFKEESALMGSKENSKDQKKASSNIQKYRGEIGKLNGQKEDMDMNERQLRKKRTGILNQIRESLVSN